MWALLLMMLPGGRDTKIVYPGAAWETRTPEQVGLSRERLDALRALVGGRGCVVRHGYMVYTWGDQSKSQDIASAVKPILSTLLLLAVQEGKLMSVDAPVADFEPRLTRLNSGKDAGITWRHLASQTSGYGLAEAPGKAWAYNDYALALYYDTLMGQVYRDDGTHVLKTRLADALQFQDAYTFEAFGPDDRPGRLAVSVRDLARFGLLALRGGRWRSKQVVPPKLLQMALSSPVPADLPVTSGKDAAMLPGQRSLGGGKNITPAGPGLYSFNWWLNRTDKQGRRLYMDAPPDTYVANGHGGKRMLWVFPSLDLIVAWNDADMDEDPRPGDADARCNRAARLIREAVLSVAPEGPHPPGPLGSALARTALRLPPKTGEGGDRTRRRYELPSPVLGGGGRGGSLPLRRTHLSIRRDKWHLNGEITYRGAKAEGLLLNVRMVNAVFEDRNRPDFDADANTEAFIAQIPDYVAHGVRAFTIGLQGGYPGYEGAVNSAFAPDGALREPYRERVERVIAACDRHGAAVILGCYYQRQDQVLRDEEAMRAGIINVAKWIRARGFTNVVLEIANEFGHSGFDHRLLKTAEGQVELIRLAKQTAPGLLVSTSGLGDGALPDSVARVSDFLLIHFNGTPLDAIPARLTALKGYGKPIMCNEDAKIGEEGAKALALCVASGVSWGLMEEAVNQHFPFHFQGAADDPVVYRALQRLTTK